jgi:aubergine-like protein
VEFVPEVERRGLRMRLVEKAIENAIFDGAMLFLPRNLGSVDITTTHEGKDYIIKLTYVHELPEAPNQLMNIIFKKILRYLSLKQIGRQYYDPTRPIKIPQHKLELWPGYFTSVGLNQTGTMLLADVSHKVLRTDTVLDFLYEIQSSQRDWRQAATQQLLGQIVLTRYNNRTYRIDDVMWDLNPRSTFTKRTGDEMSYCAYYAQTYNKTISEMDQPLLLHRHRRRGAEDQIIYLIPELCSMTGYTDEMRADFHIMKDISEHTRPSPSARAHEMRDFISAINKNENVKKAFQAWDLEVNPNSPGIPGRILNPETITFGGNKKAPVDARTAEWSFSLNESSLLQPTPLRNWLLLYPRRNQRNADDFYNKVKYLTGGLGMDMEDPTDCILDDDKPQTYVQTIKANLSDSTQLVVCICPNQRKDRYDAIKQLLCLQIPTPSQCLLIKSLTNPKRINAICRNICMQMACKQGGELWRVDIPLPQAMVVGIDVYHDTAPGGKRSAVGFCASMNQNFTRHYSRVTFQDQGQEIIDTLHILMAESLRRYFALNKALPQRIIVYRDGVGDGMLGAVLDHEVSQFYSAFADIGETYKPKLAVVVVKKRIHTRIFASDRGQMQNPLPGTVVDSVVVHPNWYDFFLVSQSVRQGTVTPSHYHVITDDTGLNPDQMQTITYKLCHLYYNWPGTIRVPAPCQYAHKLAFLVGQSLHKDPGTKLANSLFFL